jgi:hypothetical protein
MSVLGIDEKILKIRGRRLRAASVYFKREEADVFW